MYVAPGVVKITGVFSISSSTSHVKWNPPVEPNGIITGYEIIYSVYGEIHESVIGPLESNKHASNITNLGRSAYFSATQKPNI